MTSSPLESLTSTKKWSKGFSFSQKNKSSTTTHNCDYYTVIMRPFISLLLLACVLTTVAGFSVAPRPFGVVTRSTTQVHTRLYPLHMSLTKRTDDADEEEVEVNILEDVDPLTLTAIGFAAIAINFIVFANMGDAGLGGFVARIINAARS
jgi:hypothetical protein